MITKYPPTAVPAYNEIIVEDNENTSIRVAETGGTGRETTLHHVRQNGVARFDLKNFVSKLFRDAVTVIPTQGRPGWAFTDNRLQAGFTVGGRNHVGVNAVQRKGETLDLFDYGAHGALTLRPAENNVIRIPKYGGFPVGVSGMYKSVYGMEYASPTTAELVTPSGGYEVGLPWFFTGTGGGFVDWGDGTVEPFTCQSLNLNTIMKHTYAVPGRYTVQWIPGSNTDCHILGAGNLSGTPGFADALYSYYEFSERTVTVSCHGNRAMGIMDAVLPDGITQTNIDDHFRDCAALVSINPEYFHAAAGRFTSAVRAFMGTVSLTSLPSGLFTGMGGVTDATRMFYEGGITATGAYTFTPFGALVDATEMFRRSKISTIDRGAFPLKNVARLDYMFEGCTALASLPPDLFEHFTAAESFKGVFSNCSALATVPAGLFRYNTVATSFDYTFEYCRALVSLPVDLFRYNTGVTSFASTFYNCDRLNAIPADLFRYNTGVTSFQNTFAACQMLASVPAGLFRYNTAVTSFQTTFEYCHALASLPVDLFRYNIAVTSFAGVFQNCTALATVPADLFRYNIAVTSFQNTFGACENLIAPSGGIFTYNNKVTNFDYCFYGCKKITAVDTPLPVSVTTCRGMYRGADVGALSVNTFAAFAGAGKAPNCDAMFGECARITSIPSDFLAPLSAATNHLRFMFVYCESLVTVPSDMFAANVNLTDITGLFFGCLKLKNLPGTLFDPCPNLQVVAQLFRAGGVGGYTGPIPAGLFAKNRNIIDFTECFAHYWFEGGVLTGGTPKSVEGYELWERAGKPGYPSNITGTRCFYGQNSMTNYASIPTNWK